MGSWIRTYAKFSQAELCTVCEIHNNNFDTEL